MNRYNPTELRAKCYPEPPVARTVSRRPNGRVTLVLSGSVRWAVVCAVTFSSGRPVPATAAIIETDAVVSTTVQELIDGVPGSVTSDSERLSEGAADLPLSASGRLTSTDLEGVLVSTGQSISEFSDPARLDQPNPEEFALEVASYSNADTVSYSVISTAEEFRTVVFTTPGSSLAAPEIEFGLRTTRTVESRVFLNGAVLFWSTEPGRDLTDMLSELEVSVTREDTGSTLFETTLMLAGEDAEQIRPITTGPIRFEIVDLDELSREDIDAETLSILQRVEQEGTLVIVVIPQQEHPYTYVVTVDQPLVLKAAFRARVRNIPGGTGVAAVFGRPFENLADFIEDALPGVNGISLQRSVNSATAARTIGLVSPPRPDSRRRGVRLCGAFGLESAAALGLGLFFLAGRARRLATP